MTSRAAPPQQPLPHFQPPYKPIQVQSMVVGRWDKKARKGWGHQSPEGPQLVRSKQATGDTCHGVVLVEPLWGADPGLSRINCSDVVGPGDSPWQDLAVRLLSGLITVWAVIWPGCVGCMLIAWTPVACLKDWGESTPAGSWLQLENTARGKWQSAGKCRLLQEFVFLPPGWLAKNYQWIVRYPGPLPGSCPVYRIG